MNDTSRSALPKGPGATILRAPEAAAWRDGFRFLDAARAEAQTIVAAARKTYQEQHARGYEVGRREGAVRGTETAAEITAQVDRYLAGLENDVVELAMTIVRQTIGEMDASEVLGRAAANALSSFREERSLRITVHPEREEGVRAFLATLGDDERLPAISVDVDPEMGLDACTVSSAVGSVDASVEAQLEAIAKGFAKADAKEAAE
jgi:type III secretion protein L